MKSAIRISLLTMLSFAIPSWGQDSTKTLPDAPFVQSVLEASGQPTDPPALSAASDASVDQSPAYAVRFGLGSKFRHYLTETFFNPSAVTAPAFRAGLRMANPPGKGATRYPAEWRQGAEAFGRNYGDAVAERVSFQTARFVIGAMAREDPRYVPWGAHNLLARSVHALSFTLVDQSDSGHCMPALSNFVGAAAGGFIGNGYLPAGFNDVTHAGQRATVRLGTVAAGNLFREFAPQMPRPMRAFLMLIAR